MNDLKNNIFIYKISCIFAYVTWSIFHGGHSNFLKL